MSEAKSSTSLHLYKQNFKFSAAHFLIFDAQNAEKLHGHNYQVKVDIDFGERAFGGLSGSDAGGAGGSSLADSGFLIDFNVLKKFIHARLQEWDEMVLLPARHPEMKTEIKGSVLEVKFRDRFYAFPKNEVHLLPMTNTSVEQLSRQLAQEFFDKFKSYGVRKLTVYVEETAGQGASHEIEV